MTGYGTFAASVLRASRLRHARFGQFRPRSVWMLADYLDEVEAEVLAFDVFVRELEANKHPTDSCSHVFFSSWNQYVNADPLGYYDNGRPYGWRAFYSEYAGLFPGFLSDEPIWAMTEAYEDELIRFHDEAVACNAKPPKRPERAHQPPPPEETPVGQLKSSLKYALIIGGVVAGAYVLRSLPAMRGDRK